MTCMLRKMTLFMKGFKITTEIFMNGAGHFDREEKYESFIKKNLDRRS